jgi:hypothetical protein
MDCNRAQVYVRTAYTTVSGGDNGELVTAAYHLVCCRAPVSTRACVNTRARCAFIVTTRFTRESHASKWFHVHMCQRCTPSLRNVCVPYTSSCASSQGVAHPPGYPLFTMLAAAGALSHVQVLFFWVWRVRVRAWADASAGVCECGATFGTQSWPCMCQRRAGTCLHSIQLFSPNPPEWDSHSLFCAQRVRRCSQGEHAMRPVGRDCGGRPFPRPRCQSFWFSVSACACAMLGVKARGCAGVLFSKTVLSFCPSVLLFSKTGP